MRIITLAVVAALCLATSACKKPVTAATDAGSGEV